MPKIKLRLNESSIDAAIQEIRAYRDKVQKAAEEIVHKLTEQGVSLAKLNASYMDIYDSGELVRGIESRYVGGFGAEYGKGYVISTAAHSIFCEFGTGVVGANNPHPEIAVAGWRYDSNQHGELGWWYIGKDGQAHWTKGMPSRPYMYETAKMLRNMVVPIAKGEFK